VKVLLVRKLVGRNYILGEKLQNEPLSTGVVAVSVRNWCRYMSAADTKLNHLSGYQKGLGMVKFLQRCFS